MHCAAKIALLCLAAASLLLVASAHQDHQAHQPTTTSPSNATSSATTIARDPSNAMNQSGQAGSKIGEPLAQPLQATQPLIVGAKTIVDLSHPLHNGTIHWPIFPGFTYTSYLDGDLPHEPNQTHYVKADGFTTSIHCGTHLDAPNHFNRQGWSVEQIPLSRLIDVQLQVIDLSAKVQANRSYSFTKADFIDSTGLKSLVTGGSVVLVYTGLSKFYADGQKAYLGTETNNTSEMHIPGFSKEAAQYLVEQGVYGVGLDAPSADSSQQHGANGTMNPVAHAIFSANNIYIIENVSNKLFDMIGQDSHMRLTIAPLAIVGGSGSPVRLVAVMAHNDCYKSAKNSSPLVRPQVVVMVMALIAFVAATLKLHK